MTTSLKNQLLFALMLTAVSGYSQPFTTPRRNEYPVYGQYKSLIGVVRYWNPSYFYPIHASIRPYLHPKDTLTLYSAYSMDSLMKVYKITNWYMTDTFYMAVKIK